MRNQNPYQLPNVPPASPDAPIPQPTESGCGVVAKGAIGTCSVGIGSGTATGITAKLLSASLATQVIVGTTACLATGFGFFLCFICGCKPCCCRRENVIYQPTEERLRYDQPPPTQSMYK